MNGDLLALQECIEVGTDDCAQKEYSLLILGGHLRVEQEDGSFRCPVDLLAQAKTEQAGQVADLAAVINRAHRVVIQDR